MAQYALPKLLSIKFSKIIFIMYDNNLFLKPQGSIKNA